MRTKLSTLSQQISINANTLSLPRGSIHDAYILKFNMHVLNETAVQKTVTIKEVLKTIEEIRLVTDSVRVHYSLNGYDLALLNARVQKVQTNRVLDIADKTLAATTGTADYSFCLYLDEGDIIALAHNQVDLTILFNGKTSGGITVQSQSCTVTMKEHICSSAEMIATYGKDLERVVEPKVYAVTVTGIPEQTEFNGVFDLPTGTLLRGCMLDFELGTDQSYPSQIGILRTVPDRVELEKEDWDTHRAMDEIIYQTKFPAGVINYDYGNQWQDNGLGKDGWSYAKGDIRIAMKTKPKGIQSMRYISLESLVNIGLYQQTVPFTEY